MQFVSRIFLVAGAILASIHQPSRSAPRDPASHQGMHQTLGSLRGAVSTSSPAFKVAAFGTVSRLVRSKGRVSRRGSPSNPPTPLLPPPTFRPLLSPSLYTTNRTFNTQDSVELIVSRAARYEGPRDLVVYDRPLSLVVYAPPIQYIQFWVDPHLHQVAAHLYRLRFQDGASLFKEYEHLDPGNFERWVYEATNDHTQPMFTGERSTTHEVPGFVTSKPLTNDGPKQQPEEPVSRTLASLYAFGAFVSFFLVALEEYSELRQVLENNRHAAAFLRSDSATLRHIESQIPLDEVTVEAETESTTSAEGEWWNDVKEGAKEVELTTTYLDTSISQSTPPFDSTISTPEPAQPTSTPAPSRRTARQLALAQRPSGARFKSAAWKRCRAK